jgi:phosphate ABC transporter permease protein PstC/phosphate ABC transporter permease subunit PstA
VSEKAIVTLLFLAASAAIAFSLAIIYTLMDGSFSFFSNPTVDLWEFFTGKQWIPTAGNPHFGILPLLAGTLLIAGGAILIATPLGVSAAIFLSEFAGERIRSFAKPIIEILAGIPSIVYGFFALMFISPLMQEYFGANYFNAASAIIVVAIMILPIVISISDDAMKAVPQHMRETSLGLGATRWETATKVVVPAASSGIIASILLGLARAIGETMIVALVAGSVANFTLNPFEEVMTMSVYIVKVATGDIPPGPAVEAAFAVGLLLFAITYLINVIASRVVLRIKDGGHKYSKKTSKAHRVRKAVGQYFSAMRGQVSNIFVRDRPLTLRRRYMKQRFGVTTVSTSIGLAAIFLAILLYDVLSRGLGGLSVTLFTAAPSRFASEAGVFPAIMGSVYLMLLTLVFAAPLGVGAAIYLNEFARDNRYTRFLRRIIQNLAGVPSIVFGLMGLTIFVRLFDFGYSLLSGSLILTIMILPIIVVSAEEAFKSVPQGFREAAWGLGATKWQGVRHHVVPNALPGTLTGIILSLSRAIGETAPILFIVAFFSRTAPTSIFEGFMALPSQIFFWTTYPKPEFHELAASTIIVLLIILFSMNAVAIFIRQRAQARRDW